MGAFPAGPAAGRPDRDLRRDQRAVPPAELNRVFFLQLSVVGSTMGSRDQLGRLLRFCEQSGARPRIDRAIPLAQAADGFAAMIVGELFGKVVFTVG